MGEELEKASEAADDDAVDDAEPPPAPARAPLGKWRRRIGLVVVIAIALVAIVFIFPRYPRAQHVRIHLGGGSSRLVSVSARVGRGGAWDRDTKWLFPSGAPPAIVWDFDLANGNADVEVELATKAATESKSMQIELRGGDLDVDVADAMKALP